VEQKIYHVLLEGRKVGPYDRRTIVGMRIKKTLTSGHVLISTDGDQLTVGDLIGKPPVDALQPERNGASLVQATYTAGFLDMSGKGLGIPRFKGEVEARVQRDVLRVTGRYRKGFGWKDERVKLSLKDVMHARVKGSQLDLWLRHASMPAGALQRISLELFTPEAACELADWLPAATAWSDDTGPAVAAGKPERKLQWILVGGVITAAVVITMAAAALLHPRVY
jgi:hypothetical protein